MKRTIALYLVMVLLYILAGCCLNHNQIDYDYINHSVESTAMTTEETEESTGPEGILPFYEKTEKRIKMFFKYGTRYIEYQLVKTDNLEINAWGGE